ncbi:hypothetical protein L0668_16550 [Paraglaciecola aquimarina]|uniref:Uncharacterized protein n=1 Tax=Paraglaciecola algarum TaxID=3050085 RepID=A0ABS9DA22_9ALTE|nr:hypothetical protein [Paraglaciecola sp. G1-23]MCF2949731.1 hypothetical protein [Paraglaciecola sp. G1-23]
MAFVAQMMMTPEQIAELPQAEQGLYQNIPLWVNLAFACAVFGGALGCVALCFKKAIALPALLLSVMGVLVQMYHSFFITDSIKVYGPGAAVRPSLVTIIALFLLWLATHAKSKSWIN